MTARDIRRTGWLGAPPRMPRDVPSLECKSVERRRRISPIVELVIFFGVILSVSVLAVGCAMSGAC